jgi:hypothetical protein
MAVVSVNEVVAGADSTVSQLVYEDELSNRLGLSPRTFQGWRVDGSCHLHIKTPQGRIRYDVDQVNNWLGDRTHCSTSEYGGAT